MDRNNGDEHKFLSPMQFSNTCIHERKASMDMNISMDIHVKTVDMEEKFHIHGRPATDTYGVVVECGVGAAGPQQTESHQWLAGRVVVTDTDVRGHRHCGTALQLRHKVHVARRRQARFHQPRRPTTSLHTNRHLTFT